MAGHPQNSPRGLFVKASVVTIGANTLTSAATGLGLSGGIALSGQSTYLTASAASPLILPTVAALPSARVVGGLAFVSNSTGKRIAFHSTGTTWKYIAGTSVLA